ncbi:MAG: N-acetyltransferase [Deltaproteobacteria bacterium]|jgi:amino-acid N-acetyltransferase|nr:N-acetyltransferase [Deltaproteobacteria bacterium]
MEYQVRKARATDVGQVYGLLKRLAAEGLLLPRSYSSLYEMLQTLYVAESGGGAGGIIVGAGALQVSWEDLAEVRSLCVAEGFRGCGVGRAITAAIEADARELAIRRMFALTYVPEFFFRLGYRQVSLDSLPQKVWAVCFSCVHYPDCREIAVVKELDPVVSGTVSGPDPRVALAEGAVPAVLPGAPVGSLACIVRPGAGGVKP